MIASGYLITMFDETNGLTGKYVDSTIAIGGSNNRA